MAVECNLHNKKRCCTKESTPTYLWMQCLPCQADGGVQPIHVDVGCVVVPPQLLAVAGGVDAGGSGGGGLGGRAAEAGPQGATAAWGTKEK